LKDSIGGRLVLDESDQNPFLIDALKSPTKSAFQCQLFYLMNRFKQQESMTQLDIFDSRVISDYYFSKNHIYATQSLSEKEFLLYKRIENMLEQEVSAPDLIVYLQCSIDKLWLQFEAKHKHIAEYIDKDELKRVDKYYQEYFFNLEDIPVLILNTTYLDFQNENDDYQLMLEEILKHKTGQRYLMLSV
jgi:deoxyadenosine/deoxycytidine kinase